MRSRQLLGMMNDVAYNGQVYLSYAESDDPVLEACLKLCEMPSKPIDYESPGRLAKSLFEAPGLN